jgi:hypothetical protein
MVPDDPRTPVEFIVPVEPPEVSEPLVEELPLALVPPPPPAPPPPLCAIAIVATVANAAANKLVPFMGELPACSKDNPSALGLVPGTGRCWGELLGDARSGGLTLAEHSANHRCPGRDSTKMCDLKESCQGKVDFDDALGPRGPFGG